MYIPKPFAVHDRDTLYHFIESNSFGIIVSNHDNVPVATHLPLLLDKQNECLIGHFARPNKQWTDIGNQVALVIFHGPHHYISPSWYETNQSVPTWNYAAVHVYGTVELIKDRDQLLTMLHRMIEKYEAPGSKYKIDESNLDFVEALLKGIVGFKVSIDRIEGKWKLSQNHSRERQIKVIEALESLNSEHALQIADLMRKNVSW